MERALNRMTIRQLRLVIAIGEEGNLVGAAKRLHMTQPAVTKALKETEGLLGVALFDRTNRGVVPTIYGMALIAHARIVTTQLNHAAEEIRDIRDGTGGRVAVGAMPSASAELLPRAIARLRAERQNLVVAIAEGTNEMLLPSLRTGGLDFVVGRLPEFRDHQDLSQETLFVDAVCIVVRPGHPLVGKSGLSLKDLHDWPWILPRPETTLRREVERAFREAQAPLPNVVVESGSLLTNRFLLLKSDYLTVWPWQVARRDWDFAPVAILPVSLPTTVGAVGIARRSLARLSPAAEAMLHVLRAVARDMDDGSSSV